MAGSIAERGVGVGACRLLPRADKLMNPRRYFLGFSLTRFDGTQIIM